MLDEIMSKRDEIYAIAGRHNADRLWVFGSCARKEEKADSDVDILVRFTPNNVTGFSEYLRFEEELGHLLGRKVDLVPNTTLFASGNSHFAAVVCKEAVRI